MQRKPGFPVANCCIKMPDSIGVPETGAYEDENEQQLRRQQLINFGHAQWGFNNWNWAVTKQELDFVDLTNGKYCAGVVAFVSVQVKSFDIHRENIGYATSNASNKGFAIFKSRKCAVTNALRETLLSFGGSVATELMELLESHRSEVPASPPPPAPVPPSPAPDPNQNLANRPAEPKNSVNIAPINVANKRQDPDSSASAQNMRPPHPAPVKNAPAANTPREPPIARTHPMPANLPPALRPPAANLPPAPPAPPPPAARPNSNDGRLEGMTEEEARAERRRRQRLAQEEFRLKQLMKNGTDDGQELNKNPSTFERLLADIVTQDRVIEETEDSAQAAAGTDWQTNGLAQEAAGADWQTRGSAQGAARPNWEIRGTVQAPARPDWQSRDLAEASVKPDWQTRGSAHARADGKRKTPPPEGNSTKKRANVSKLDIVQTD